MSDAILESLAKQEVVYAGSTEQTATMTADTSTVALDLLGTDEGVWLVGLNSGAAAAIRFGGASVAAAVATDVTRLAAGVAKYTIHDKNTRYARAFSTPGGTLSYNRVRLQ